LEVIGTSLYNLAEMVYDAGVKLVCGLTNSVLSTIQATVDKIVDAFQAFVTWAVDFVRECVQTAIDSLVSLAKSIGSSWAQTAYNMASGGATNIDQGQGTVDEYGKEIGRSFLKSDLYLICLEIAAALSIALVAVIALTAGAGFLIEKAVVPVVLGLIMGITISVIDHSQESSIVPGGNQLSGIIADSLGTQLATDLATIVGIFLAVSDYLVEHVMSSMAFASGAGIGAIIGFALSMAGLILSLIALGESSLDGQVVYAMIGFGLSFVGTAYQLAEPSIVSGIIGDLLWAITIGGLLLSFGSLAQAVLRHNEG
jgi:hypothetical protein